MNNKTKIQMIFLSFALGLTACGSEQINAVQYTPTPLDTSPLGGPLAPLSEPHPVGINPQPTPDRQIIKPEEELPQTFYETGLNFTIVPEAASTQELISVGDINKPTIATFNIKYSTESYILFHNEELNVIPQTILVYSGINMLLPNTDGTNFELKTGSNLLKVIAVDKNGFKYTYYITAEITTDSSQIQAYELGKILSEDDVNLILNANISPGTGGK